MSGVVSGVVVVRAIGGVVVDGPAGREGGRVRRVVRRGRGRGVRHGDLATVGAGEGRRRAARTRARKRARCGGRSAARSGGGGEDISRGCSNGRIGTAGSPCNRRHSEQQENRAHTPRKRLERGLIVIVLQCGAVMIFVSSALDCASSASPLEHTQLYPQQVPLATPLRPLPTVHGIRSAPGGVPLTLFCPAGTSHITDAPATKACLRALKAPTLAMTPQLTCGQYARPGPRTQPVWSMLRRHGLHLQSAALGPPASAAAHCARLRTWLVHASARCRCAFS